MFIVRTFDTLISLCNLYVHTIKLEQWQQWQLTFLYVKILKDILYFNMYNKHLKMLCNKVWLNLEDSMNSSLQAENIKNITTMCPSSSSSSLLPPAGVISWCGPRLIWYGVMFKDIHTSVNQSGRVSTLHLLCKCREINWQMRDLW